MQTSSLLPSHIVHLRESGKTAAARIGTLSVIGPVLLTSNIE